MRELSGGDFPPGKEAIRATEPVVQKVCGMTPRKKWSTPLSILAVFLMTNSLCIWGVSEPLPFLFGVGGSCGRALTCTAGSGALWIGALIVVIAIERYFPD